jgi:hypothetical protein
MALTKNNNSSSNLNLKGLLETVASLITDFVNRRDGLTNKQQAKAVGNLVGPLTEATDRANQAAEQNDPGWEENVDWFLEKVGTIKDAIEKYAPLVLQGGAFLASIL